MFDDDDMWGDAESTVNLHSIPSSGDLAGSSTIDELAKTYNCWSVFNDDTVYTPASKVSRTIPPGAYEITTNTSGDIFFNLKIVVTDDLLRVKTAHGYELLDDIKLFWKKKETFKKMGFIWKRGILLYGPPGSGKTSTINMLSKDLIDSNGIIIYMNNPVVDIDGLKLLRATEPDRPILYIIEDIDSAIKEWSESRILSILDGESQIDNIVFIATTNYVDELPTRITDRPSRFDVIREIAYPNEEARHEFIISKNPRLGESDTQAELDDWIKNTEGFTFSHIKEVIILVECLGTEFAAAIRHMQQMREGIIAEDKYPRGKKSQSFGFTGAK